MSAESDLVRDWLIRNLKDKGRGATRALADFLKLPSQAVTRMTNRRPGKETRGISASELLRMADFFGVPPPLSFEHNELEPSERTVVPIMGYIGAGAEIDPDYEQVPSDGLDQVELRVQLPDDMIAFQVRGDSMLPKYDDGDIIVVYREQQQATDSLIGRVAAVRTYDGHRFVKRIMPGTKPHTFNLESINARTIIGARIAWSSEIWVIVPAGQVRHIGRSRSTGVNERGKRGRVRQ